jgi:uncharacterized protein
MGFLARSGATQAHRSLRLHVSGVADPVDARLVAPPGARVLYALAHGAGAGMTHPFLEDMSQRLAARAIATLRFQFPYMQAGRKRPDPPALLMATVRAALDEAARALPGIPLVAGGKSMGGRMTSRLMAEAPHPDVRGLIFLGFPLHPAGAPASERAEHLAAVSVPMLFLQGTRDALADLTLMHPVIASLGARATMHVVDGGDHSFEVLARTGRTADEIHDELAGTIATWLDAHVLAPDPAA